MGVEEGFLRVIDNKEPTKIQRPDMGAILIGRYGFPAAMWPTWAAASGLPGARWEDASAQRHVAGWVARTLYGEFRNWGMVAIGWRYGAATARKVRHTFGGVPPQEVLDHMVGGGGVAFINKVTTEMAAQPQDIPPGPPPGNAGGGIELRFEEEEDTEGILNPEPEPERTPGQLALMNVLSQMADRAAGGKRMAIEDIEVGVVPTTDQVAPPISTTPADTQAMTQEAQGG